MSGLYVPAPGNTEVYDLRSPGFLAVYSLSPREAVIAAYAQFEKKDYNTWDYAKYESLVEESARFFLCGDFSARKTIQKDSTPAEN